MSLLILIRHAEAHKNQAHQFSGDSDRDALTEVGNYQLEPLRQGAQKLVTELKPACVAVLHAESNRALATANAIKPHAQIVLGVAEFRSIDPGALAGKSEDTVRREFPDFAASLDLYRAGLISSYGISYPGSAESLRDFEARVQAGADTALKKAEGASLIFVVAHRSALTALLISFARRFYAYPTDFFGYIPIEPAATYAVSLDGPKGEFLWANQPLNDIPNLF